MSRPSVRPRQRRPSILTVLGVLFLVAGLSCLGWIGYQYVGTNVVSERAFRSEQQTLQQRWEQSTTDEAEAEKRIPGEAIALLRIPDLGADYVVPVLAGTDPDTLARGVGWYESSVSPGQRGNFALAGHRVTHGEPFAKLLDLKVGALVTVETREASYTYRLVTAPSELTVADTDTWVLDADPIKRSDQPGKRYLTLTTCQDLFRSPDRSVAFGELVTTKPK